MFVFFWLNRGEIVKIHSFKENKSLYVSAISFVILTVISVTSLTGCGGDNRKETNLSFSKDGKITNTIYEAFDKDYYDIDELSDMANREISYYNSEYDSPKIAISDVGLIEDKAIGRIVMTFETSSDYSHFNQANLFYGTVQEALDKGFELSGSLVDKNGKVFDLEKEDYLNKHIVITGEKTVIYTPYNIEYMTSGVELLDKKEADLTNVTTDLVQILLSK